MTRKPRIQRKRVKALTDPQPEFVSLVTAGANMTPFKALKSDEPVAESSASEAVDPPPVADIPTETAASFCAEKADTHEIAKIVFQKAAFATVEEVRSWLSDGGFSDFDSIDEDAETYSVGKEDERASRVEWEGITIYITDREIEASDVPVEPNSESSPTAVTEVQPVAKSEDVVAAVEPVVATLEEAPVVVEEVSAERLRYDDFKATLSAGTTMDKVLAEGFDGLPPAIHEVTNAMYVAVRNCAMTRDVVGIKAAASAYGDFVAALVELFPAGMETEAAKSALADAPALEEVTAKEAEQAPIEDPHPLEASASEQTVEVEAVKTAEPSTEAVIEAAPNLAALVIKLAESVQELTNNFSSLHNEVAAKADALAERVTAIETERQSRKGADVDEVETETMNARHKKSQSGIADLSLRAALGIQRPPR